MMGRVCDICHGARSIPTNPVCPACNGTGTSESRGQIAPHTLHTTGPGVGHLGTVCPTCGSIGDAGAVHVCLPLVLDMMRADPAFMRELAMMVDQVRNEEHIDE